MRYFTSDLKANGETDFHGETEWMTTDQRVDFLNKYATYASKFWNDEHFDKILLNHGEATEKLKKIKPQPLTTTRRTIPLTEWKVYGYKADHTNIRKNSINRWELGNQGVKVKSGKLVLEKTVLTRETELLNWRFRLKITLQSVKSACSIALSEDDNRCIHLQFDQGQILVNSAPANEIQYQSTETVNLEVYGDFVNKRFFVSVNGKTSSAYLMPEGVTGINRLKVGAPGELVVDDILLFNFVRDKDNIYTPYYSTVVIDENFEEKPSIEGWQYMSYDDSAWKPVELPSAHGGLREKEEYYYLRKIVKIEDFERATLKVETVDPGGEVWINGEVVAVVNNRHPVEVDVSRHLKRNSNNIIAVRVNHHKISNPFLCTPSDHYIGWFLGRAELLLSSRCMIKDVFVHTTSLSDKVEQHHQVVIQNSGINAIEGNLEINYYPWYPSEGNKIATTTVNHINIRPLIENKIDISLPVENAQQWTVDKPCLYKVETILKDKDGNRIDDYVTTTGIRTIDQKDGELLINGKPIMLNGAQIMGFRYPVETVAKTNRCVDYETIIQDLLMIKKMNGNLLRIHVHAEKDTTDGINDPRYAELADQLGVFLIWQTAGWTREGEAWNVDFNGYPKYMKQVFNHPSIVMWEASNHPNRFKRHDISDSNDFMNLVYETIASVDTSRLISPTSHWLHTHYGNYDGSVDYQGNPIEPNPILMKRMMTRGNQDSYTGYGAKWTALRHAPNSWAASNTAVNDPGNQRVLSGHYGYAASCLAANDKAYFNFEHEESAAQPNWNLAIREPWYQVQSYEWDYDTGSIGRRLEVEEWKTSQAWQAFSAWEATKKQTLIGYDGFSWCTLESGANMFTYQKPLVDPFGLPKLAYYANRMIFQEIWAGTDNVDVVIGPDDQISSVIFSLGEQRIVNLIIELQDVNGKTLDKKTFKNITIKAGRTTTEVEAFRFKNVKDGFYFIKYTIEHKHKK